MTARKPRQAKLRLEIELSYEPDIMHSDDQESLAWFRDQILSGTRGKLILHSNLLGDTVGTVKVLRCEEIKPCEPPVEQKA